MEQGASRPSGCGLSSAAGLEGGAQQRQIDAGIGLGPPSAQAKYAVLTARQIGVAFAPWKAPRPRSLCRPSEFGRFGPGTPSVEHQPAVACRFSIQRHPPSRATVTSAGTRRRGFRAERRRRG